MTINVTNLKIELNNLNNLLEDYEEICLNMYNEFSASSFFWYDDNAKRFFNDINKEKIKMNNTFKEFSDLKNIYTYIVNSYEKLGNNIYCELKSRGEITNNINNYINKLRNIINSYNNLDLKYCSEVYNRIINEKSKLNSVLSNANSLYNKVNSFYNQIEEIEKEVNLRISRISVETIKENLINDYV